MSPVIALVGNPNVGKSTLFNALTGLRQHTGNWPGKTVASARGSYTYAGLNYTLVDLPGTYSLTPASAEEEVTARYLVSGEADVTLVVTDATCLERNLSLALQVLEVCWPVVVCVNLLDEAEKKGIHIDLDALRARLGCPVTATACRGRRGLEELRRILAHTAASPPARPPLEPCTSCHCCTPECRAAAYIRRSAALACEVTSQPAAPHRRDRAIDRVLTGPVTGMAVMLLALTAILWLTIVGSNIPSRALSTLLMSWQEPLRGLLQRLELPPWLVGAAVDGLYRTAAWVVSVMLPPIAIFFPLFTLLEDIGYLPRAAFNLDHFFRRSGAHGRQALTMCMALGCNACGVTGCRIIQSPRERLLAILTNAFMPCNGKFPTLIAIITLFFAAGSGLWASLKGAAALACGIILAASVSLLASRCLSSTVLRGAPSSFSLELPPYRLPRVDQVLIRSILDRTVFVLGRAVSVAAPAGLLIWAAANITVGDASILHHLSAALDPAGRLLGVDGIILLAFLLGFPANEIVVPAMLMGYLSAGALTDYGSLAQLGAILTANGWTGVTALCTLLLTLFHLPCGTTCLTIWRETGSVRWTLLAMILPAATGVALCLLVRTAALLLL